jgi:hypothetical protein
MLVIHKKGKVEAFNSMYSIDERALEQMNSTHTMLLPKKPGACEPNDFWPISLGP